MLLGIFGLEPKDLNVELFFLFDRHFFLQKTKMWVSMGGWQDLLILPRKQGTLVDGLVVDGWYNP